ncbi:uncharacterized protein METZ01_LOCUS503809 [marine metagenome]|uniref:Uncharacterized protein n=1 Tax=marine metagenome TaxID=408172 RepID=A0A383E3I7_9ZZZZ
MVRVCAAKLMIYSHELREGPVPLAKLCKPENCWSDLRGLGLLAGSTHCTPHCAECTSPDRYRRTPQIHILEFTGANGPDGRLGQISVIWGTEGREFKSPQPDR